MEPEPFTIRMRTLSPSTRFRLSAMALPLGIAMPSSSKAISLLIADRLVFNSLRRFQSSAATVTVITCSLIVFLCLLFRWLFSSLRKGYQIRKRKANGWPDPQARRRRHAQAQAHRHAHRHRRRPTTAGFCLFLISYLLFDICYFLFVVCSLLINL